MRTSAKPHCSDKDNIVGLNHAAAGPPSASSPRGAPTSRPSCPCPPTVVAWAPPAPTKNYNLIKPPLATPSGAKFVTTDGNFTYEKISQRSLSQFGLSPDTPQKAGKNLMLQGRPQMSSCRGSSERADRRRAGPIRYGDNWTRTSSRTSRTLQLS